MDELFHVSERKSTIGTELRAGLTTFLAMAYIIAVNPAVLSGAGIDAGALACATCLGAGIMTICMGIFANRPLACASGLGVNAMIAGITTTVCGGDWHVAMSVIFLEGVVILLLVLCGLREAIMDAIPVVLRHAISVGLGLFIAMIGLCDAGIITAGAGTLVGLGDITSPTFIVGIISILVTVALACRNVPGSLLIGIVVAVIAGIPLGVTQAPTGIIAPLDFSSIGGPIADAGGVPAIVKVLTDPTLLIISFSLLMSDFFDTMGTAMAVAKQGEFLTEDGNVEYIDVISGAQCGTMANGGPLYGVNEIVKFEIGTAYDADFEAEYTTVYAVEAMHNADPMELSSLIGSYVSDYTGTWFEICEDQPNFYIGEYRNENREPATWDSGISYLGMDDRGWICSISLYRMDLGRAQRETVAMMPTDYGGFYVRHIGGESLLNLPKDESVWFEMTNE